MPFVNEAQRKACYAQQRRMNEKGLVSDWDCHEFAHGKKRKTPRIKHRTKATPKKVGTKDKEKIFKGPRGGEYVIRKNKKVYI
jgi:hypothetical protein